jgi:hypothetical protein
MIEQAKQEVRMECKQGQQEVREECEQAHQEVREECKQAQFVVRQECKQAQQQVREEFRYADQQMREELTQQIENLQREFQKKLGRGGVPISGGHNINPPPYDGQTSWAVYKRQFEAASSVNGWNDEEKTTALLVALRGSALEVIQTLPVTQQHDYEALVAALDRRYSDQHHKELYRAQLKTRQQKSGESLQQFEAEIRRLINLAYPAATEEFREELSTQYFIDGIRDMEIQRGLRLTKFNNSSEALIRAMEVEAVYNVSKPKIRAVAIQESNENNDSNLTTTNRRED